MLMTLTTWIVWIAAYLLGDDDGKKDLRGTLKKAGVPPNVAKELADHPVYIGDHFLEARPVWPSCAEPGRRRVSVQPAGAAFRRRVEAHVVPLTISESAFRAESRTRSSSSWRAATLAPYHDAVGDWRSPSPGPAHYFPATSSKATAPGKPAAAAIRSIEPSCFRNR